MTLRTLNYGNYGIFLIMGNAGYCPSTVLFGVQIQASHCEGSDSKRSIVAGFRIWGLGSFIREQNESFQKFGLPYFGVLIIWILLFWVPY